MINTGAVSGAGGVEIINTTIIGYSIVVMNSRNVSYLKIILLKFIQPHILLQNCYLDNDVNLRVYYTIPWPLKGVMYDL